MTLEASPSTSENKKRVLVTGLEGFTGVHLAAELERHDFEVWGLDHVATNRPRRLVADLTSTESLRKAIEQAQPQYVVHLAGVAFVGHGNPKAFYDINLVGTRNLLEALAQSAGKLECVLLASSANIYGNSSSGLLNESTHCHPANDYAVSKLAMEFMAKLWIPQLPIVLARPFNYTGQGQTESFLIPKIVAHFAQKKQTIELGNMEVWREFNDVRDVAFAYRKLLEAKPIGQAVNVCSGQLVSLKEVLALAESITAHTIKTQVNPAFVRPNEVIELGGDPALLKKLIKEWQPRPLNDTLKWMLESAAQVKTATTVNGKQS